MEFPLKIGFDFETNIMCPTKVKLTLNESIQSVGIWAAETLDLNWFEQNMKLKH